jgi:hypothetical protein
MGEPLSRAVDDGPRAPARAPGDPARAARTRRLGWILVWLGLTAGLIAAAVIRVPTEGPVL